MNTPSLGDGVSRRGERVRPVWQRALGLYVTLFAVAGVVYGLLNAAQSHDPHQGVGASVVFGAVLSAVLGSIIVVRQRHNRGSWSPRRHVTLTIPDSQEVARRQVHLALYHLRAGAIHDDAGTISARTAMSGFTWGSKFTVRLATVTGGTCVTVHVKPRMPATFIDTGDARDVIDTLTYYLTPANHQDST